MDSPEQHRIPDRSPPPAPVPAPIATTHYDNLSPDLARKLAELPDFPKPGRHGGLKNYSCSCCSSIVICTTDCSICCSSTCMFNLLFISKIIIKLIYLHYTDYFSTTSFPIPSTISSSSSSLTYPFDFSTTDC